MVQNHPESHFKSHSEKSFIMYCCVKCDKTFSSGSKFKAHNSRKVPCRPTTHFCSMCKKGLVSRRSLCAHKKRCRENSEGSIDTEVRIQNLKKKVDDFFEHLSGDFIIKLSEMEKMSESGNVVPVNLQHFDQWWMDNHYFAIDCVKWNLQDWIYRLHRRSL